jgi:ribosome biogenesis protein Nip4
MNCTTSTRLYGSPIEKSGGLRMSEVNRPDLKWVQKFLENYGDLVEEYPELFKQDELDDWKIVKQIIKEKLDETT